LSDEEYFNLDIVASKKSPSTNVPICCSLCPADKISGEPRTIWKYNAMYHSIAEHLTPVLLLEFIGTFFVCRSEEEALGIDAAKTVQ
jgi:hypothetical protein